MDFGILVIPQFTRSRGVPYSLSLRPFISPVLFVYPQQTDQLMCLPPTCTVQNLEPFHSLLYFDLITVFRFPNNRRASQKQIENIKTVVLFRSKELQYIFLLYKPSRVKNCNNGLENTVL